MQNDHRPNTALRAARLSLRLSQDELAERMRQAGAPSTTKRTIQRYESGEIANPRPASARALEVVTRLPIASLGFPADADTMVVEDGRGGHDLEVRVVGMPAAATASRRAVGTYTGIWLSEYQYYSSSRDQHFSARHHIVLLQHDDRLTVRGIPGSADSLLTMDLTVEGSVVTGTWSETTGAEGYYRGARYHGAIQMQADATGLRMAGKWVGFGKDGETNTGPWTLAFQEASTGKAAMERYARPPEAT
ncbi:helix-turn-helix transcriptional regulator [Actinoplanes sp. NPDC051346]|uniref:helix-turn-helix domain-containing protein n=1 Tax=Actinoplanes sp. NPDC051346 TaxID=3155048 RepID=UPI00343ACE10